MANQPQHIHTMLVLHTITMRTMALAVRFNIRGGENEMVAGTLEVCGGEGWLTLPVGDNGSFKKAMY